MGSGNYDDLEVSGQLHVRGVNIPADSPTHGSSSFLDFSVERAAAYVRPGYAVLRTGGVAGTPNLTGAYNGGGTGNKSILGKYGYDQLPIGQLTGIEYTWHNVLGLGGVFFNPPSAGTVQTPKINLVVDFAPSVPGGDLRILLLLDDSLAAAITAAIGTYSNPGGLNVLTYAWSSAMNACIVNSPPNAVPGGVVPSVSVGANWFENAYSWAALVAANPTAILVDAFPANPALFPNGDGGMPAGAVVPSILMTSGDSGNLAKSGKVITSYKVNGQQVLP